MVAACQIEVLTENIEKLRMTTQLWELSTHYIMRQLLGDRVHLPCNRCENHTKPCVAFLSFALWWWPVKICF